MNSQSDVDHLYLNLGHFLSRSPSSYLGYTPLENVPSIEKYYKEGHQIVIDLRDSKGYTGEGDPVNRNNQKKISVNNEFRFRRVKDGTDSHDLPNRLS